MLEMDNPECVILTLPVGFRPEYRCIFTVYTAGNATARVDVDQDGSVKLNNPVNNGWLSLEGIHFAAAP